MADKDDLVESAKVHGSTQHAHVLLAIDSIQSAHRFVAEKCFVTNTFTLSHVIDRYAQVNGFIDQNEVAIRQLLRHAGAVPRHVLSPKLDGRREGWYGFRRGFGSKLDRLGVPAKINHDDAAAHRCVHP